MSAPQTTKRPPAGKAPARAPAKGRPAPARKKRRRRSGAGKRAFHLLIVLVGIAAVLFMALKLFSGPGGGAQAEKREST